MSALTHVVKGKTHARDRTVSRRKRSGSRRNKKQKNVKSFLSDYPKAQLTFTILNFSYWRLPESV